MREAVDLRQKDLFTKKHADVQGLGDCMKIDGQNSKMLCSLTVLA